MVTNERGGGVVKVFFRTCAKCAHVDLDGDGFLMCGASGPDLIRDPEAAAEECDDYTLSMWTPDGSA